MGCDIHLHVEIRVNDKWEHYSEPYITRDYELFTKLANVRNDSKVVPISDPRGLPTDISSVTALCAEWCAADWHSHSWLSAAEIREVEEWWLARERYQGGHRFGIEQIWGYLFGNSLSGVVESSTGYPPEVTDVRIVFWFDN